MDKIAELVARDDKGVSYVETSFMLKDTRFHRGTQASGVDCCQHRGVLDGWHNSQHRVCVDRKLFEDNVDRGSRAKGCQCDVDEWDL